MKNVILRLRKYLERTPLWLWLTLAGAASLIRVFNNDHNLINNLHPYLITGTSLLHHIKSPFLLENAPLASLGAVAFSPLYPWFLTIKLLSALLLFGACLLAADFVRSQEGLPAGLLAGALVIASPAANPAIMITACMIFFTMSCTCRSLEHPSMRSSAIEGIAYAALLLCDGYLWPLPSAVALLHSWNYFSSKETRFKPAALNLALLLAVSYLPYLLWTRSNLQINDYTIFEHGNLNLLFSVLAKNIENLSVYGITYITVAIILLLPMTTAAPRKYVPAVFIAVYLLNRNINIDLDGQIFYMIAGTIIASSLLYVAGLKRTEKAPCPQPRYLDRTAAILALAVLLTSGLILRHKYSWTKGLRQASSSSPDNWVLEYLYGLTLNDGKRQELLRSSLSKAAAVNSRKAAIFSALYPEQSKDQAPVPLYIGDKEVLLAGALGELIKGNEKAFLDKFARLKPNPSANGSKDKNSSFINPVPIRGIFRETPQMLDSKTMGLLVDRVSKLEKTHPGLKELKTILSEYNSASLIENYQVQDNTRNSFSQTDLQDEITDGSFSPENTPLRPFRNCTKELKTALDKLPRDYVYKELNKAYTAILEKKIQAAQETALGVYSGKLSPDEKYALALIAELGKGSDLSVKLLTSLIKDSPNDPVLYTDRGINYYAIEKNTAAEKDFKKAISLKKDFPEAYLALGTFYNQTGRKKQAAEVLKKGLAEAGPDKASQLHKRIKAELSNMGG